MNSDNTQNNTNKNSEQLFELIQTIQNKLNEENSNDKNNSTINSQNKNNVNNLDNQKNNVEPQPIKDKNQENTNNGFDFSNIAAVLQKLNLSNTETSEQNQNDFSNSSSNLNIDINTIMKMQKIMSNMNKKDPRKDLLLSLKPFLRKSRQDKINEYVTILSITDALGILGKKGSD